MTCKEAHKFLEIKQREMTIKRHLYNEQAIEINGLAISALKKQIPEKPIRANRAIEKDGQLFMYDENEYWKCPMCTSYDVPLRENQRYCHYCGQALDWSDTDDF